jgi:hypothetical protein
MLEAVASQAHADVLGWATAKGLLQSDSEGNLEYERHIFAFYDEIMRAERAGEITANAAIRELVRWRMQWKQKLT